MTRRPDANDPDAIQHRIQQARAGLLSGRGPGASPDEITRWQRDRPLPGARPAPAERQRVADQGILARGNPDELEHLIVRRRAGLTALAGQSRSRSAARSRSRSEARSQRSVVIALLRSALRGYVTGVYPAVYRLIVERYKFRMSSIASPCTDVFSGGPGSGLGLGRPGLCQFKQAPEGCASAGSIRRTGRDSARRLIRACPGSAVPFCPKPDCQRFLNLS